MYYLWEFICGIPEILVSCAYFEILLVVYEMTDPLLEAPSHLGSDLGSDLSYSSSNFSMTCLPHAVIWVDSSYHHQFFPYYYLSSRLHTSHFHIYHPHMFIDFEFDVSLYILFLLPISPHVTLFASHHYY